MNWVDKMSETIGGAGGFVANNKGNIVGCVSYVDIYADAKSGGFCGINSGIITGCSHKGQIKKIGNAPVYKFCAIQDGIIEDSLEESLSFESGISKSSMDEHLNDSISKKEVVIEISNKIELLKAAEDINNGLSGSNVIYRLTTDIDFGGGKWKPFGVDQNTPFTGCFDGAGHEIRRMIIEADKVPYAGLFGFIGEEGEVRGLTVDCVVIGKGDYAAALCGWNDGIITECVTKSVSYGSRYTAGFAGHNSGLIKDCSSYGKIRVPGIMPWWVPAVSIAAVFMAVIIIMAVRSLSGSSDDLFAPRIFDPNAKPLVHEKEIMPEPAEDIEEYSTAFTMNADMQVSRNNYAGAIGLNCPSWSKKGIVATIYVSGSDLEANGASYTEDAVVYTSGLIGPGMGIDVVILSELPDGSLLPVGDYTMIVQLDFYDSTTNELSSFNTKAPINVMIR